MIKIALLLVIAAAAAAQDPANYGYGYASGYAHGGAAPSFHEYAVNDQQAHRQNAVNARAEAYGTGTGTADIDGVPGTHHSAKRYNYGAYGAYGYNNYHY